MSRLTLEPKYAAEVKKQVFDFASVLAVGETISTQTVTAAVYSGTDASPSALISGSATASGTKVTQTITGGLAGVVYTITCSITTSLSQTLRLMGYLTILPTDA